jgi:DUF438 domain-containing protein
MNRMTVEEITGQVLEFSEKFFDQNNKKELVEIYGEYLTAIQPEDVLDIFNLICHKNWSSGYTKNCISKLSNIFYKYLNFEKVHLPSDNYILNILLSENRKLELVVSELKQILKKIYSDDVAGFRLIENFRAWLPALKAYNLHYLKIEKLIIPEFKKVRPGYSGYLKIMKAYHLDYLVILKELDELLLAESPDLQKLNTMVGTLFFLIFLMMFREEYVFFPVAIKYIPENRWDEMVVLLKLP